MLGALFGAQNKKGDRTELVMLITPRLVANSQQAREITSEFRKKMGNVTLDSAKNTDARDNSGTGEIEREGQ